LITESDVASVVQVQDAGFTYYRRRTGSLDVGLLVIAFGSLAAFSLLIAAGFAAVGAWPVLPFSGLEIAALGVAAQRVLRRSGDFERVAVVGDQILVEIREQGRVQEFEFHCAWAQLGRGDGGTMALRSHGRAVTIGRFCGEDGRLVLARVLRSRIGDKPF
jgi:uncharacterized membrane protein